MKYILSFLFLFDHSFAQNLLVNGDFEDENICTEYRVNCAPEGWISTSDGFENYFRESGRAFSGTHCIAIEAGVSNKRFNRTYFRSGLLCALRKGNRYLLEFYIKSPHRVTDSAGVYFTHYDFLFDRQVRFRIKPSLFVKDDPAFVMPADSSWQKVSLIYTARGDEAFITFGNFSKRDINGYTGISRENHFFIFIDKVSLSPLDKDEGLCTGWQQVKNDMYNQNERHEYLRLLIRRYGDRLPEPPALTQTTLLRKDTLLLPDILFQTGKAALEPESSRFLDSLCRALNGKTIDSVVIEGHTDTRGAEDFNHELSMGRANAIAGYLSDCASLVDRNIVTRGKGSDEPVADNNTMEGRRKNRRVEIYIYTRESN